MLQPVLTKRELMTQMRRFIRDKERGISMKLFADLCGVNKAHLLDVFWYRSEPLTEYIQRRVDKGYKAWQRGEVAIMQLRNRSKYIEYRREAKPRILPTTGLQMINGKIGIRLGMRNIDDYSQPPLFEGDNNGSSTWLQMSKARIFWEQKGAVPHERLRRGGVNRLLASGRANVGRYKEERQDN